MNRSEMLAGSCMVGTSLSNQKDEGSARIAMFDKVVSRRILMVVLCAIMLGPAIAFAGTGQTRQKIATVGLNEFDLAQHCYGLDRFHPKLGLAPSPRSLFGYAKLSGAGTAEFVYITSRYYVRKGPYGDPQDCEFGRNLYRFDDGGFRREELNEDEFARVEESLRAYAHSEHSHPDKKSGAGVSRPDSIGDCLFPIEWQVIGGQDYALLSIVADGAVVDYVIPHYERRLSGEPSTCFAWGERHLTNSTVVSNGFEFFSLSPDRIFIESKRYQTGFMFKSGVDFQCIEGSDSFSRHVLVRRDVFDSEIRPGLQDILLKNEDKSKSASGGEPKIMPFHRSVFLNQEFAAFVAAVAEEKGCQSSSP